MKKSIYLLSALIIPGCSALAQEQKAEPIYKKLATTIATEKSGNKKDILTSLFRIGIENFLGSDNKFTFSSTFYGIDSLINSGKPTTYERERTLRKFAVNLELGGDGTITTIGGGITFTLINETDVKFKRMADKDLLFLENMANITSAIRKQIQTNPEISGDLMPAVIQSLNDASRTHDYSTLHPLVNKVLSNPDFANSVHAASNEKQLTDEQYNIFVNAMLNGKDPFQQAYLTVAAKYAHKPLLTFAPSAVYDRENKQGEYSFGVNFTMGISKNIQKAPWELEAKSVFKIANDSTLKRANYENKPWSTSLGINKVLVQNKNKESTMELKLFSQIDHQFAMVPPAQKRNGFTFNATYRIRIAKIWFPVSVKYDPEKGNFLGFLSVSRNF